MQTETEIFGHLPSGEPVHRVTIRGGGLTANILTWGSVIQDLRLEGHAAPLVLGFENFQDYLDHSPYFGATPGRNANRIGGGRFSIGGTSYQLECNEKGVTHLHGGSDGIAKRLWTIIEQAEDRVVLTIVDPDGRAGYPGNCTVTCTYAVTDGGVLNVVYESTTDRATICNVCQHSYFNLDGTADAFGHDVMIAADPLSADGRAAGADRRNPRRRRHRFRPARHDADAPPAWRATGSATTIISVWRRSAAPSSPSPWCAASIPAFPWKSAPPSPVCSSTPASR